MVIASKNNSYMWKYKTLKWWTIEWGVEVKMKMKENCWGSGCYICKWSDSSNTDPNNEYKVYCLLVIKDAIIQLFVNWKYNIQWDKSKVCLHMLRNVINFRELENEKVINSKLHINASLVSDKDTIGTYNKLQRKYITLLICRNLKKR